MQFGQPRPDLLHPRHVAAMPGCSSFGLALKQVILLQIAVEVVGGQGPAVALVPDETLHHGERVPAVVHHGLQRAQQQRRVAIGHPGQMTADLDIGIHPSLQAPVPFDYKDLVDNDRGIALFDTHRPGILDRRGFARECRRRTELKAAAGAVDRGAGMDTRQQPDGEILLAHRVQQCPLPGAAPHHSDDGRCRRTACLSRPFPVYAQRQLVPARTLG